MSRANVSMLIAALAAALAGCDSPPPTPSGAGATASAATLDPASASSRLLVPSSVEKPLAQPTATAIAEPEAVTAQHLLVAYKGARSVAKSITRTKADAKKRAEEALAKARKGDDFTALVKTYSDEPGAADRLGSLGKFKRDAMVKPFSDAAFALKVGDVSDVVETEFGFHVIKRNQ
jgi:NIMA-interacting peptidyl-prolyl cis-trans isomerase 1